MDPLSYFQIDARHRPYIFADYEQLMNQEDDNSSILLLVTVITVILKLATLPTLKVNIVLDPFLHLRRKGNIRSSNWAKAY